MKLKFYNDYELDPEYNGKTRVKELTVDMDDKKQLYDIIKKRRVFKLWQPTHKERKKLVRRLEELDTIYSSRCLSTSLPEMATCF